MNEGVRLKSNPTALTVLCDAKKGRFSRHARRRTARHPNRSASVRLWWPGCIGPWEWVAWAGRNIRVWSRFLVPVSDSGNCCIHRRLVQPLRPPTVGPNGFTVRGIACDRRSADAGATVPGTFLHHYWWPSFGTMHMNRNGVCPVFLNW